MSSKSWFAWMITWVAYSFTTMLAPDIMEWHQRGLGLEYSHERTFTILAIGGAVLFAVMCFDVIRHRKKPKE